MENITLWVETYFACLENAEFDVASEVKELEKGLRVRDVEIIAGHKPQSTTAVEEVSKVLLHEAKAADLDEGHADIGAYSTIKVGEQVRKQWIICPSDEGTIVRDGPDELRAGRGVAEVVALARDDIANSAARIRDVPGITGNDVDVKVEDSLAGS